MNIKFLVPNREDVAADLELVPRVGDQVVLFDDPEAYEVQSVTWKVPEGRVMVKLGRGGSSGSGQRTAAAVESLADPASSEARNPISRQRVS